MVSSQNESSFTYWLLTFFLCVVSWRIYYALKYLSFLKGNSIVSASWALTLGNSLSHMQAEPSPTTGSFFNSQLMQGSGENAALLLEKKFSSGNTVDERASSSFEFRFHTGANSTSGLSSIGMSVMP